MRGSRMFRVNILSRRSGGSQSHQCRGAAWRWSVTVGGDESATITGKSTSLRAMRKDARNAALQYLKNHSR
jgi:tetraacyldisaccharide-1-P 4'-kinase